MFREVYKRDNELIKPDAVFLEQMKQSLCDMQQDEQSCLQETAQPGKGGRNKQKEHLGILRFTAAAACLVLVAGAFFWNGADYKDGGLKSKIVLNQDKKQYEQLKEILSKSAVIYKQKSDAISEEKGQELTEDETKSLTNDILKDVLFVISDEAELEKPVFYMAEDSAGHRSWFAVDQNGNIWVH